MGTASIFRCCTAHDGTYLGPLSAHDPSVPGDGPWYLAVVTPGPEGDQRTEYGFGTRDEAISELAALTVAGLVTGAVDIEDAYLDGI